MQRNVTKQFSFDAPSTAISRMQTTTVPLALVAAFAIITEFAS